MEAAYYLYSLNNNTDVDDSCSAIGAKQEWFKSRINRQIMKNGESIDFPSDFVCQCGSRANGAEFLLEIYPFYSGFVISDRLAKSLDLFNRSEMQLLPATIAVLKTSEVVSGYWWVYVKNVIDIIDIDKSEFAYNAVRKNGIIVEWHGSKNNEYFMNIAKKNKCVLEKTHVLLHIEFKANNTSKFPFFIKHWDIGRVFLPKSFVDIITELRPYGLSTLRSIVPNRRNSVLMRNNTLFRDWIHFGD